MGNKSFNLRDTTTRLHWWSHIELNCGDGWTGGKKSWTFLYLPLDEHAKRSERVNSGISELKILESLTFPSIVCRDWTDNLRLRLVTHFNCTDLKSVLSQIFKYFCSVKSQRCSTPWWQGFLWSCSWNNRTTGWLLSQRMECFTWNVNFSSFLTRLLARTNPLGPKKRKYKLISKTCWCGFFLHEHFYCTEELRLP